MNYAKFENTSTPSAPSLPPPIIVSSNPPVIVQVAEDAHLSGFYCRKKTIIILLYVTLFFIGLGIIGPIIWLVSPEMKNKSYAGALLAVLLVFFAFYLSVLIAAQRENLRFMRMYFYILVVFIILTCLGVIRNPTSIISAIFQCLWAYLIYRYVEDLKFIKKRQEECAVPKYFA